MNILLFGPPSAGKGTAAEYIKEEYDLKHIATGDIFRYNIKNETELGKIAKSYMDKGNLVPDELTIKLVETALEDNFLLDGFPRNLGQAKALDIFLEEQKYSLDGVIVLDAPEEDLVLRVINRRICSECGASYHLIYHPTKVEGICDICGGKTYQRDDDTEETYRQRYKVYQEQTEPILEYYKERGIIHKVDASGSMQEVKEKVLETLEAIS